MCHEKWLYDDERTIATLIGFEIHCESCDAVAHAGRAIAHGLADEVIRQLCKVNDCTPKAAQSIIDDSLAVWKERSRTKWQVAVAAPLLKAHPQLRALQPAASLTLTSCISSRPPGCR
jgi:hypothetical protein